MRVLFIALPDQLLCVRRPCRCAGHAARVRARREVGPRQLHADGGSADGAKKRTSSGSFEFARPNRFRFAYAKPFEQLIVSDGQKVWIHDVDLNQVSVRKLSAALGATPAALLAGASLDKEFELVAQPSKDGVDWVQATPRQKDGAFQSMRVGFRGKELAAVEILDSFGQRSVLQFSQYAANVALTEPELPLRAAPGADVIEQ